MSKVQAALEQHMAEQGTSEDVITALLRSRQRAKTLLSGEGAATLYEATVFAAYFKTSVRDFVEI